ncbi:MAG: hypothetical protein K8H88_29180, partial [Sandaracinaceae bacterium]|nr:hypothetical protein [Sandaracinaceae bacterium]
MLMRNKAADMGATHVITEMSDSRTGSAGEPYFVGRGLAYDCPRDAVAPAQAQPSGGSSGGESGEGGEAAPVDDEAPPR